MPVTKYYTVNGQILGERTGSGGYRRYGTDALGSVTTTYTSTGTVENTYRNAPYGTEIAKTGAAADPNFTYNGSSGYRGGGPSYAEFYVRARHLCAETAGWSSRDRLRTSLSGYSYALRVPTTLTDRTGLIALLDRAQLQFNPCYNQVRGIWLAAGNNRPVLGLHRTYPTPIRRPGDLPCVAPAPSKPSDCINWALNENPGNNDEFEALCGKCCDHVNFSNFLASFNCGGACNWYSMTHEVAGPEWDEAGDILGAAGKCLTREPPRPEDGGDWWGPPPAGGVVIVPVRIPEVEP